VPDEGKLNHACNYGNEEGGCDAPATRMIILHETLGNGRILDIDAWFCDLHYKMMAAYSSIPGNEDSATF
jgi:hypothetical protein